MITHSPRFLSSILRMALLNLNIKSLRLHLDVYLLERFSKSVFFENVFMENHHF